MPYFPSQGFQAAVGNVIIMTDAPEISPQIGSDGPAAPTESEMSQSRSSPPLVLGILSHSITSVAYCRWMFLYRRQVEKGDDLEEPK